MVLYHGTDNISAHNILANGINLNAGKLKADFGQGFYTTDSLVSAKSWAIAKSSYGLKPYIVSVEFDDTSAKKLGVIKEFEDRTLAWCQFIACNRVRSKRYLEAVQSEHNVDNKFHIVRGFIADGDVVWICKQLGHDLLPVNESIVKEFTHPKFARQTSFHTEYALSFVKSIRIQEIR